jgi:hypothetical protein
MTRHAAAEDEMARTNQSAAAGSAPGSGVRFQAQVTAWWAARILLRTPVGERYVLPAAAVPERLYCESGDHVDDIRIELSDDIRIYGQCKRSISVGKAIRSIWAEVLLQFAKQFEEEAVAPTARRYVLFYEEPNGTLRQLAHLLDRYRDRTEPRALVAEARTDEERKIAGSLEKLLGELQKKYALKALGASQQELLRRMCIVQLHLSAGEAHYLSVLDALQHVLLREHEQCLSAMNLLFTGSSKLVAERRPCDRTVLSTWMVGQGIALRERIDYRKDFERLDGRTREQLAEHRRQGRALLRLGNRDVPIERPVVQRVLEAARNASLLVVGDAGAGKTGCLMQVAQRLQEAGVRVWYWAADSLRAQSVEELARHLQLTHTWSDLFREARSTTGATLVVDGVDGLREREHRDAYRRLIEQARAAGLHVVASIRTIDAHYDRSLQDLFRWQEVGHGAVGDTSSTLGSNVAHIVVGELDPSEFSQVLEQLPEVQRVLEHTSDLSRILHNLFNLNLLCQVLEAGKAPAELSRISTQAQLFEFYWQERVEKDAESRDELPPALGALVEQMVREGSLQIQPDSVRKRALEALSSAGLIRHPPSSSGRSLKLEVVEFSHHLLFDYVAERLFVRKRSRQLAEALATSEPWVLMLRPSLRLYLRSLWTEERDGFWDLLHQFERKSVSGIHRVLAYAVVAEEARSLEDLEQLVQRAQGAEEDATHWRRAVKGVINTASVIALPRLFERDNGTWWLHFAHDLVRSDQAELVYAGRRVFVRAAQRPDHLGRDARRLVNAAGRALVRFYRSREPVDHAAQEAIKWVCQTFGADFQASGALVHELLTPPDVERSYMLLRGLVERVNYIAANSPELARAVYEATFKAAAPEGTDDRGQRGQSDAQVLGARAAEQLAEHLPSLLQRAPSEATRALLSAIRWYATRDTHPRFSRAATGKLRIISQSRLTHDDGDEPGARRMLQQWQTGLVELARSPSGAAAFEEVWSVLKAKNESALVWERLLDAAREAEAFFWPKIWQLLCEPAILFGTSTHKVAVRSLQSAARVLTQAEVEQIEAVILEPEAPTGEAQSARVRNLERFQAYLLQQIPTDRRGDRAAQFLARSDGAEDFLVHDEGPRPLPEVSRSPHTSHAPRESATEASPLERICAELEAFCADGDSPLNPTAVFDAVRRAEELLTAEVPPSGGNQATRIRRRITYALSELACSKAALSDEQWAVCAKHFEQMLVAPLDVPFQQEDTAGEDESGQLRRYDEQANAVRGTVGLAASPARFEPLRAALSRIREHPQPWVRYHLAIGLCWRLFDAAPDFVWETLEAWVKGPWSQRSMMGRVLGVALGSQWLLRLRQKDAQRADQFLHELIKVAQEHDEKHLWRTAGDSLGALYAGAALTPVLHDDLEGLIADARARAEELLLVLSSMLRVVLPIGDPGSDYELTRDPAAVERCCKLAVRILDALDAERVKYEKEQQRQQAEGALPKRPEWLDLCRDVARVFRTAAEAWVCTIAPELASELRELVEADAREDAAVDGSAASSLGSKVGEGVPRTAVMDDWWGRARPLLVALLRWPLAQAADDLIVAFSACAWLDAPESLAWLHRVIKASAEAGTLDEVLAVDTALDTLARLMAKDSSGLAFDENYWANFHQTLDVFLDVGWPRAVELALQIDTLSRHKLAATG